MTDRRKPNDEQSTLWNEGSGRAWVEMQEALDRLFTPVADLIMREGFPGEGRRVLDVGCGAGATTLAMARRLGPSGSSVGVDISALLLARARSRAAAEGLVTATFVEADAQVHHFEGAFDAVISRFGVMFFDDPVAAFSSLRRAAQPDAKLACVAWRSADENPFVSAAGRAAAPFLPNAAHPAPGLPGPFAFAEREHVRRILEASGWSRAEVRPVEIPIAVSRSDVLAYATKVGPVGRALRDVDEPTRERIVAAVREAFEPFIVGEVARFTLACWLLTV